MDQWLGGAERATLRISVGDDVLYQATLAEVALAGRFREDNELLRFVYTLPPIVDEPDSTGETRAARIVIEELPVPGG